MDQLNPNAAAWIAATFLGPCLCALDYWRRRQWTAALISTATSLFVVAAIGYELVRGLNLNNYATEVATAPVLLAAACFFLADLVGLPDLVAITLGIGLRDRRAIFYEALRVPWREADHEMAKARDARKGRRRHVVKAGRAVDRIAALEPPSSDWSEFRDDLVDCLRPWVKMALERGDPGRWPARPREYPGLFVRFQTLGNAIAEDHGVPLSVYRARNGRTKMAIVLAGVLTAWVGLVETASGAWSSDQRLWLELCALFALLFVLVSAGLAFILRLRSSSGDPHDHSGGGSDLG